MRKVDVRTLGVVLLLLYTESGVVAAIWMKASTTCCVFYFRRRVSGRLRNLLNKCGVLKYKKKAPLRNPLKQIKLRAQHLPLFLVHETWGKKSILWFYHWIKNFTATWKPRSPTIEAKVAHLLLPYSQTASYLANIRSIIFLNHINTFVCIDNVSVLHLFHHWTLALTQTSFLS